LFVWTEICEAEIKSCQSTHLVRIQGTQNPEEVVLNHEVIAVVANQIAGKAAREAAEKARKGDFRAAARSIRSASAAVQSLAAPELTGEAQMLLDETRLKVDSENLSPRDLKNLVSESRTRTRPTTRTLDPGSRKKSKPGQKSSDRKQARPPEK
jgi:stringent starvation protein B